MASFYAKLAKRVHLSFPVIINNLIVSDSDEHCLKVFETGAMAPGLKRMGNFCRDLERKGTETGNSMYLAVC